MRDSCIVPDLSITSPGSRRPYGTAARAWDGLPWVSLCSTPGYFRFLPPGERARQLRFGWIWLLMPRFR
jgi:hypothetical protein